MSERFSSELACVLGDRLRHFIALRGYRQNDFATSLGLSPSRLSNYLQGTRLPDFFTLCRIAVALDISVSDFCPEPCSEGSEGVYLLRVSGGSVTGIERLKNTKP